MWYTIMELTISGMSTVSIKRRAELSLNKLLILSAMAFFAVAYSTSTGMLP